MNALAFEPSEEAKRLGFQIKLVPDADGYKVGELFKDVFTDWDVDWSQVHPYWFAAVQDDTFLAVVNVSIGKPWSRVDDLVFQPELDKRHRAIICRDLGHVVSAYLKFHGSSAEIAHVRFGLDSQIEWMQNRGWEEIAQGRLMMKRLT